MQKNATLALRTVTLFLRFAVEFSDQGAPRRTPVISSIHFTPDDSLSRRIFHGDAPPQPSLPGQSLFTMREEMQHLQQQITSLQKSLGLNRGLRQRFEALYDASPLGLLTHDADECIIEANLTLANLLGVERDQLIGQHIGRFIAAQDHAHFIQHLTHLRDDVSGSQRRCTLTLTSAQQARIPVQMECTLYVANPYGANLIHSSILPLAKDNHSLTPQQQDELAHEARLTALGEMTAGLAHEISQPLTAIQSYAKSCLRLLRGDTDKHTQLPTILEEMGRQSERATRIISHLRDFASKHASHREITDLDKVVQLAINMMQVEFRDNNINVEVESPAQLPLVSADAIQLEQVVINLLRNASEAMKHNENEQSPRRLNIVLDRPNDTQVRITVSDTGPGIAPQHAGQITSPFYSTKEKGMGLGLAISRTIVESHGGTLSHINNDDGGATFIVTLAIDGSPNNLAD